MLPIIFCHYEGRGIFFADCIKFFRQFWVFRVLGSLTKVIRDLRHHASKDGGQLLPAGLVIPLKSTLYCYFYFFFYNVPMCPRYTCSSVRPKCLTSSSSSLWVIIVMKFDDNELKVSIHLILHSGILHPGNLTFNPWSLGPWAPDCNGITRWIL